jgi:hypothetical protein
MLTLVKYAISVLIWAAIAALLLVLGKTLYLAFWAILGVALLIVWLGHMIYHVICWFNPDFKPIKLILIFMAVIVLGIISFKLFMQPSWNRWGSTDDEVKAEYKADEYCPAPDIRVVRTVEINVPPEYIFRWVRQMPEAGSYSWDLLDFRHRKSVNQLLEDLPDLREGDQFLMGKVVEVKKNKSITFDVGSDPQFPKLGVKCMYGGYYFRDIGHDRTRVSMVMRANYDGLLGWFYSQVVIGIGDFFMMTKQFSRLKELSERHYREKK